MAEFFEEFFLREPAIYTLFGSKPMSDVVVVTANETQWIEAAGPYLQESGQEQKIVQAIQDHL